MGDYKPADTSQPLLPPPPNKELVPGNQGSIGVAPNRKRDDVRSDFVTTQHSVQPAGNMQVAEIAQPSDYRQPPTISQASTSAPASAYKPLSSHLGATPKPPTPQYLRLPAYQEASRPSAQNNIQTATDASTLAYRPLQSQIDGASNLQLHRYPNSTPGQEAFRLPVQTNMQAPVSTLGLAYQQLPSQLDGVSISPAPYFQLPPYQHGFLPAPLDNMQAPTSTPGTVYPPALNYFGPQSNPLASRYEILPTFQDYRQPVTNDDQGPISGMSNAYAFTPNPLSTASFVPSPSQQYMPVYPEAFSLPQGSTYVENPVFTPGFQEAQPPIYPEVWEYPQTASYPERFPYQQALTYAPTPVYQPAPVFTQAFDTSHYPIYPSHWDGTSAAFNDTAMEDTFQQSPWSMAPYYDEQQPSLAASWPYEGEYLQPDNQRPSPLLTEGTSLRCGAQGCCRDCCGECCRQAEAARWDPQQRVRWASPWLSDRQRLRPCFSDVVHGSTRGHSSCTTGHHFAPPREAHSCTTRPLPCHLWSSGGSCISRSQSWPLIGHDYESHRRDNEGPYSLFPHALPSTWEPSRETNQPSFESYTAEATDICTVPVSKHVPDTAPPRYATQRQSPTTSWASYSQPQAAPSTVNVETSMSLGSLQAAQVLQPTQPSTQRNLSFKISTVVADKDAESTVGRRPVAVPARRSVATEIELLFLTPSREGAAGTPVSQRSVSVMTSFPPSQPCSASSTTSHADSVYYTAHSRDVTAEQQLVRSTLGESPGQKDSALTSRVDRSDSSHGWFQPLHIKSEGSGASSLNLTALGEESLFAATLFLNFTWRTPEGGPLSGSSAPRALPEAESGATTVEGKTDQFVWSSKAVLKNREPTTTQEYRPPEGALLEQEEASGSWGEIEDQIGSESSLQQDESPEAAGSAIIPKSSVSETEKYENKTNLLRSATSDTDLPHEEVPEEIHEVEELHEEEEEEQLSASESERNEEDKKKKKKKEKKRERKKTDKRKKKKIPSAPGAVLSEDEQEEEEEEAGKDEKEDEEEAGKDNKDEKEEAGEEDKEEKEDKEDSHHGAEDERGDEAEEESVAAEEEGEQREEAADEDEPGAESGGKKKKREKKKKKKKGTAPSSDEEQAEEADAEQADEEEHVPLADYEQTREKKRKLVPVAVPVSGGKTSKSRQEEEVSIAVNHEQQQEEPEEERDSETGVFEAATARVASPTSATHPPQEEIAPAAAEKSELEAGTVSRVASVSVAELSLAKLEEADKESERVEKEIEELELSTVQLFPESRMVIVIAIFVLLWIIFLIFVASMRHGPYPTFEGECTTTPGPIVSQPPWTNTWTTAWRPPERHTRQEPPALPTTQVRGSTATTEETLLGVFICSTEYCQKEGNYLRGLTTQSKKKPCDNFYEHVCEAWQNSFSEFLDDLPGAAVSTDTLLQSSMEAELLSYIKSKRNADVAPARELYTLCLSTTAAESTLQDVARLFRQWGSEWPNKDTSKVSPAHVWHFAAKLLRVLGVPSLVGIEIGLDPWNLEENIIEVGPPSTIIFSQDVSQERVLTLFTRAVRAATKLLNPQDTGAADGAAEDVRIALTSISVHKLEDLGSSPLDYDVDKLASLGKGVQAFIRIVFENITVLDARSRLLVRRGHLFRQELDRTVDTVAPRAMLNYLGLLGLVALSPFLPEELSDVRVLHSVYTLGRTEASSKELMCLRAVSQAYPACMSEASRALHKNTQRSVWLSQLERLFGRLVHDVTWVDNLTSLFVHYKMRQHRLARFFPAWPLGNCSSTPYSGASSTAMGAFVDAVSQRQTEQLQQLLESPLQLSTGSLLAVWPRYRLCLRLFQIPVGLVNGSVPSNGTMFALHLSRFAVRLYAAFSQLLYAGTVYEREIPLYFTNDAAETLDDLLECVVADARNKFAKSLSSDRVRNALLEQVLALQMGFLAFRRLLTVRRIWRQDFRLSTFPEMSSDQLFFLYYALDNCELSDSVFESHQFEAHRRLPAAIRVNMALRQSAQFAKAFQCQPGASMVAEEMCKVIR